MNTLNLQAYDVLQQRQVRSQEDVLTARRYNLKDRAEITI